MFIWETNRFGGKEAKENGTWEILVPSTLKGVIWIIIRDGRDDINAWLEKMTR